MPNPSADPLQSRTIFSAALLDRSRSETAACVMPVGSRRQRRARIASEDGKHRHGVTISHQRGECSTDGYHRVVEMGRNDQYRTFGPETVPYHFAAGEPNEKSSTP